MFSLLDSQPLPPGSGPYRVSTQFQGQQSFVVGVFSVLGDYRDWSFAGYLWQVVDLPGRGYQRVWKRKLWFGRQTLTPPWTEPFYLEYEPPYYVDDWSWELWGLV